MLDGLGELLQRPSPGGVPDVSVYQRYRTAERALNHKITNAVLGSEAIHSKEHATT